MNGCCIKVEHHAIPGIVPDHLEIRKEICDSLSTLPQTQEWIITFFDGSLSAFLDFVADHRVPGQQKTQTKYTYV